MKLKGHICFKCILLRVWGLQHELLSRAFKCLEPALPYIAGQMTNFAQLENVLTAITLLVD